MSETVTVDREDLYKMYVAAVSFGTTASGVLSVPQALAFIRLAAGFDPTEILPAASRVKTILGLEHRPENTQILDDIRATFE